MIFSHLLGSLLSAQAPYLFMILSGFFFGKIGLISKEALLSFAQMNIDIFLPTYLFILVGKCSFTYNYIQNWIIILSFLFYTVIAFLLSYLWCIITKIDLRYRYSFIILTCFVDIKRLYFLYIKSFCFLYDNKTINDDEFCSDIQVHAYLPAFFQGILIWYLGFNLLRIDAAYQKDTKDLWDKIKDVIQFKSNNQIELQPLNNEIKKDKDNSNANLYQDLQEIQGIKLNNFVKPKGDKHNSHIQVSEDKIKNHNTSLISPFDNGLEKEQIHKIFNEYKINNNPHSSYEIYASIDFYTKIRKHHIISIRKYKQTCKEIMFTFFQSPLFGLSIGFIIGFIRSIREWVFDTTTPVYLFYDTFNNIGNCNILLGFLIIGGASIIDLSKEEREENAYPKVRIKDYIAHLVIKVIIMPFLGIIFTYVLKEKYYKDNNVLLWTCFIQWMIPTSLDVVNIICSFNMNYRFLGICLLSQFIFLMIGNNLINVTTFLKIVDILE